MVNLPLRAMFYSAILSERVGEGEEDVKLCCWLVCGTKSSLRVNGSIKAFGLHGFYPRKNCSAADRSDSAVS